MTRFILADGRGHADIYKALFRELRPVVAWLNRGEILRNPRKVKEKIKAVLRQKGLGAPDKIILLVDQEQEPAAVQDLANITQVETEVRQSFPSSGVHVEVIRRSTESLLSAAEVAVRDYFSSPGYQAPPEHERLSDPIGWIERQVGRAYSKTLDGPEIAGRINPADCARLPDFSGTLKNIENGH